jgi:hypothetical protein
MRISKSLVGALALTAFAVSPLAEIEAATLANPGAQPAAQSITQLVQAKEKTKAKKAKKAKSHKAKRHHRKRSAKGSKSKGPGSCGTNMYFSRKSGKCEDARKKK